MKNKTPRVTIGIPVYNGEKYIAAALDSILAQTFTDFNCVISDNASTDQTGKICQSYAAQDSRIRYSRNPKNLGAAPNYNRAFELAVGEYFKWADYDDIIAPDFLEKCVVVLDSHPEVVLCFPLVTVINENDEKLGDYDYKSNTSSSDARKRFHNLILNPDTGYEFSGLMRSSAVAKTHLHGSFPASDLVFLADLALQGEFYTLPERLFFPRYHPENSSKGAGTVERDRVLFFDTSNKGKILLPKWQYLFSYLRVVHQSPLNMMGKLYCYLQVGRWSIKPDHFRALGKDILLAVGKLMGRTWGKISKKESQMV